MFDDLMQICSTVSVDPGLAAVIASIVITFGGALIPLVRRQIRKSKGSLHYPKGIQPLLVEILGKTTAGRIFITSFHYTNGDLKNRRRGLRIEGMFSVDYEVVTIGMVKVAQGYANTFCSYFRSEMEHIMGGGEDLGCNSMKHPLPLFEHTADFYLSRNCRAFYALPVKDSDENVINLICMDFIKPEPNGFEHAKEVLKEYRDRLTPLLKGAKY